MISRGRVFGMVRRVGIRECTNTKRAYSAYPRPRNPTPTYRRLNGCEVVKLNNSSRSRVGNLSVIVLVQTRFYPG